MIVKPYMWDAVSTAGHETPSHGLTSCVGVASQQINIQRTVTSVCDSMSDKRSHRGFFCIRRGHQTRRDEKPRCESKRMFLVVDDD